MEISCILCASEHLCSCRGMTCGHCPKLYMYMACSAACGNTIWVILRLLRVYMRMVRAASLGDELDVQMATLAGTDVYIYVFFCTFVPDHPPTQTGISKLWARHLIFVTLITCHRASGDLQKHLAPESDPETHMTLHGSTNDYAHTLHLRQDWTCHGKA